MSNPNLYVVGTYHFDIDGRKRLDYILGRLKPKIIALEMHEEREHIASELDEDVDKKRHEATKESGIILTPGEEKISKKMMSVLRHAVNYELKSSRNYAQKNPSSRLEYIDLPVLENGEKQFMEGLGSLLGGGGKTTEEQEMIHEYLKMLKWGGIKLFKEHLREGAQDFYDSQELIKNATYLMRKEFGTVPGDEDLTPEEKEVIKQIFNPKRDYAMSERTRELYGDGTKRLVAIVGLAHVPGLEEKIRDLEPTILSLSEYLKV